MRYISKLYRSFFLSACLAALAVSCAKDPSYPQNYSTDKVLDAWVEMHYGDIPRDTSGIYILEEEQGSGRKTEDTSFVFVNYTRKGLDMTVASTNDPVLLEMQGSLEGTAGRTFYLGPRIWRMGQGVLPYGVESALRRMREGGRIKIAVPVGRSKVNYQLYQQFSSSEKDNVIYDLELVRVLNDISAYQDSLLKDYSRKYFGGIDTVCRGFYLAKVGQAAEADSLEDDDKVAIRYIGRRLDGTVFDTNIPDSAAFYKLDTSSSDSLEFTYNKNLLKMYNSNSGYIYGFTMAINRMRHKDTVEAFFSSEFAYGAAGQSSSIPEYSPLSFKIFIQEEASSKDDED